VVSKQSERILRESGRRDADDGMTVRHLHVTITSACTDGVSCTVGGREIAGVRGEEEIETHPSCAET
jgi:hypothetical protein